MNTLKDYLLAAYTRGRLKTNHPDEISSFEEWYSKVEKDGEIRDIEKLMQHIARAQNEISGLMRQNVDLTERLREEKLISDGYRKEWNEYRLKAGEWREKYKKCKESLLDAELAMNQAIEDRNLSRESRDYFRREFEKVLETNNQLRTSNRQLGEQNTKLKELTQSQAERIEAMHIKNLELQEQVREMEEVLGLAHDGPKPIGEKLIGRTVLISMSNGEVLRGKIERYEKEILTPYFVRLEGGNKGVNWFSVNELSILPEENKRGPVVDDKPVGDALVGRKVRITDKDDLYFDEMGEIDFYIVERDRYQVEFEDAYNLYDLDDFELLNEISL